MSKERIFQIIKTNVLEILPEIPVDGIRPEESLKNIGANSIDRMDIIVKTMEMVGVTIPMIEFAGIKNIQGLVDLFYEKRIQ